MRLLSRIVIFCSVSVLVSILHQHHSYLQAATPTADEVRSDLNSSGVKRRQAIWYIYQHNLVELLPDAAALLKTSDEPSDHLAVLRMMQAYREGLDRYLPGWYETLDDYMHQDIPEENLVIAIQIIRFFKEDRAIYALERLADDPRQAVRLAAFDAIKTMGQDRLIPILLKMANHKRAIFRVYALEGMAHYADNRLLPFIRTALGDESKSVRIYAILALARQTGQGTSNHQVTSRFNNESNAEVRRRVLEVIREQRWRGIGYLLQRGVGDHDPGVRRIALLTVRDFKDRSAAGAIGRQLSSEKNNQLKKLAMDTLMELGSSSGSRGVQAILKNDKSWQLRMQAALTMGYTKDRQSIQALISALQNDNSMQVRAQAAESLGMLRTSQSSQALGQAARKRNEKYYVRSAAVLALDRHNSGESRNILEELARSEQSQPFARHIQQLLGLNRK